MEFFTEKTLKASTAQHQNWRIVAQVLHSLPSSLMLDEAVEANSRNIERTKPWVGIFHTPPNAHHYSPFSLDGFLKNNWWLESAQHLRLAVTFSDHLTKFLRQYLAVPVVTVLHPAHFPPVTFDPERYVKNEKKIIHQLGWVFRNTQAIYQLPPIPNHHKTVTRPITSGALRNVNQCIKRWASDKSRKTQDKHVIEIKAFSDAAYDIYLSHNIMFMEVFEASANNAVLDCIARNTPLVVNRHPAIEEYLGKDYPLFYEKLEDATELFESSRLLKGHHYLEDMNKERFTACHFRIGMERALRLVT